MIKWKEWMIKWTRRKNNKIKNIILSEKRWLYYIAKEKTIQIKEKMN